MRILVVGANGFLGSHIVDACVEAGCEVTAFVRSNRTKNPSWRSKGVRKVLGDILDRESLRVACENQECVINASGIIPNSQPQDQIESGMVTGTKNIIDASSYHDIARYIHISSVAIYDTSISILSEHSPMAKSIDKWNHYVRAKIASEIVVWDAHHNGRIIATVFRPSIVLGSRDRSTTPRVLAFLNSSFACIIGDGQNLLPCVVVEELAQVIPLAAHRSIAEGQAYNISGREKISQLEFLDIHARSAGIPMPRRRMATEMASIAASLMEGIFNLFPQGKIPPITRFMVWLASRSVVVDCTLASKELDWSGIASYSEAVQRSVDIMRGY